MTDGAQYAKSWGVEGCTVLVTLPGSPQLSCSVAGPSTESVTLAGYPGGVWGERGAKSERRTRMHSARGHARRMQWLHPSGWILSYPPPNSVSTCESEVWKKMWMRTCTVWWIGLARAITKYTRPTMMSTVEKEQQQPKKQQQHSRFDRQHGDAAG